MRLHLRLLATSLCMIQRTAKCGRVLVWLIRDESKGNLMMLLRVQFAVFLGIAALAALPTLDGADIYKNETAGINTFVFANVGGSNRAGITLGIGATDYQLTSFSFVPVATGSISLQSMTIELYLYSSFADLSLPPIVSQTGSGVFNPLSTATTANVRTFTPNDPTAWKLEANNNYVLLASAPTASNIGIALSNPFNSVPTMGAGVTYIGAVNTTNNGVTWQTSNSFNMWGTISAVAVPEPSTYALAAIATGVMAAVAHRRRQKKLLTT